MDISKARRKEFERTAIKFEDIDFPKKDKLADLPKQRPIVKEKGVLLNRGKNHRLKGGNEDFLAGRTIGEGTTCGYINIYSRV